MMDDALISSIVHRQTSLHLMQVRYMLRQRSIETAVEQRRQRRALIAFAVTLIALVFVCGAVLWGMLVRPTPLIPTGRVEDYTDAKPHRFSVHKLSISELIQRRDSINSEDVVFVRRESDGSWVGLLGVDTLSGCFLYWDETAALYKDVNCLGSRYTPDGRYLDGLMTGEQPQNMARLPVEVRDGQVFVRDELDHSR